MVHDFFSSVLLTYKGKVLLLSSEQVPTSTEPHLWCLIGGKKIDTQSPEQTIHRKIKHTTKLQLKKIDSFPLPQKNHGEYFYHGELTDNDVNSIERREGQRLEFFTLNELEKLSLTSATAGFLDEYKSAVEQLLVR